MQPFHIHQGWDRDHSVLQCHWLYMGIYVCAMSIALTQRIVLRNMLEGIDQHPVDRFLCEYHLVMRLLFSCLKCDLSALSWNWLIQLDHMTSGWLWFWCYIWNIRAWNSFQQYILKVWWITYFWTTQSLNCWASLRYIVSLSLTSVEKRPSTWLQMMLKCF